MKKLGFTLSEVLITLVIIGVLAAILIPPVMNNTNGHEFRTSAKKAISGLDKAVAMEYAMEGLTVQDYVSSEELVEYLFKRHMNTIEPSAKQFTSDNCEGATANSIFNTSDGMIYCVTNFHSDASDDIGSKCDFQNTTPCTIEDGPNVWIDVNGAKKPNKATTSANKPRDIYQAQLYSQKVIAFGAPTQDVFYRNDADYKKKEDDTLNDKPNVSVEPEINDPPYVPEEPEEPAVPNNPSEPNEDDFDFDDDIPDVDNPYYDQYDPNKWPSWLDFLRWLWNLIIGLFT